MAVLAAVQGAPLRIMLLWAWGVDCSLGGKQGGGERFFLRSSDTRRREHWLRRDGPAE